MPPACCNVSPFTASSQFERILWGYLHDPANVQQTSSNRNAGRLLDRVNTLLAYFRRWRIVDNFIIAATFMSLSVSTWTDFQINGMEWNGQLQNNCDTIFFTPIRSCSAGDSAYSYTSFS